MSLAQFVAQRGPAPSKSQHFWLGDLRCFCSMPKCVVFSIFLWVWIKKLNKQIGVAKETFPSGYATQST